MKPYYEHAGITIYHGDCWDVLPRVQATVLVTDPPYGVDKAHWDDALPLDLLGAAAYRTRVSAITPGISNIGIMPPSLGPQRYKWTLAAHLVNSRTSGVIGFGHWIPALVYAADDVSVFARKPDAKDFVVGLAAKPDHPSPKPQDVLRWIIGLMPDGVVLDPFMGSGTTLVAAKWHGRQAIGIEREEQYCEVAAKRLAQEALPLEAMA